MVRKRKAWAPLLVALGLALGVFGLLLPDTGSVAAQATPTATRSLPATSVASGDEFTVTIEIDYAGLGTVDKLAVGVRETLPADFSYVSNSLGENLVTDLGGGVLGFAPLGEESFTYTVTASSMAGGDYHLSGVLVTDRQAAQHHPIGGDNTITVVAMEVDTPTPRPTPETASEPSADRVLPSASVAAGGEVVVTVNLNYANLGAADKLAVGVEETLPAGFSYVSSSLGDALVSDLGNGVIGFAPLGEASFSYTVTAPNAGGSYPFSGILKGVDGTPAIGGDSAVTVEDPSAPSATRSFSSMYIDEGSELIVTIDIDYAGLGAADKLAVGVEETLPAGFEYVSSSLGDELVTRINGVVGFAALGEDSFTYTVTASSVRGSYSFAGILKGLTPAPAIEGETDVTVGPEPTPVPPTATPVPTDPDDTPTSPTRTPRATPRPSAPSTPVPIEIVSDVTMAEGATVVQPDSSSVVSSSDGMATVMLPNTSRARTYQVMVSSDAAGCSGGDLAGAMQACVTITSYDAEGSMESGVMLIRRATVVMMLDSAAVEELGGLPVVFQANALGAFSVSQRDDAGDSWGSRRFTMGLTDDGGIAVTVTSLRSLGSLALAVDEEILQTAMYQVAGITPTPVPPSTPLPAPATPAPTAVPTPEPTAVPPEVEPEVGDTTLPVGLLVVLALTGALMVYTGSRVMRRKPATARR